MARFAHPLSKILWLMAMGMAMAMGACTPKKKSASFHQGAREALDGDSGSDGSHAEEASLSPLVGGQTSLSDIAYLERGPAMLQTRLWMLNQARSSIRVQSFLFKGDEVGSYLADRLIALHKKGLKVSVIVDEMANVTPKSQILFGRLAKNGIPVEGFDPAYLQFLDDLQGQGDLEQTIRAGNRRYHDKLFIVDGEDPVRGMAIVGGANLANEYFWYDGGDAAFKWMDQDVILRGPVVADVTAVFDSNQTQMAQNAKGGLGKFAAILTSLNQVLNWDAPFATLLKLRPALMAQVAAADGVTPALAWHQGRIRFTQSRPRLAEDKVLGEYLALIKAARSTVQISNSYFLPTDVMQNALADAARRGVAVTILTNAPETGDLPVIQKAGRALYEGLMTASAKDAKGTLVIYEWKGDSILGNGFSLHHSKYMVVDGRAAIVGSFNIDPRSQFLNSETIVAFDQADVAQSLAKGFAQDIGPGYAQAISPAEAKSYAVPNTFLDLLTHSFLVAFRPSL